MTFGTFNPSGCLGYQILVWWLFNHSIFLGGLGISVVKVHRFSHFQHGTWWFHQTFQVPKMEVLTYISSMDTAYLRENPPKNSPKKAQETLHFGYLKMFADGSVSKVGIFFQLISLSGYNPLQRTLPRCTLFGWWVRLGMSQWAIGSHSANGQTFSTFWDYILSRENKVQTFFSGSIGWVRVGG